MGERGRDPSVTRGSRLQRKHAARAGLGVENEAGLHFAFEGDRLSKLDS